MERGYLKAFYGISQDNGSDIRAKFDTMFYAKRACWAEVNLKIMLANVNRQGGRQYGRATARGATHPSLAQAMKWQKPVMPVKGADLIEASEAGPLVGEKHDSKTCIEFQVVQG